MIRAPVRRQIILIQRADDDDETLAPHAEIDEHANDEQRDEVRADFFEPQQLRHADVDADEHPAKKHVGMAEETVAEHPAFIRVAAIPRDENFHQVDVINDEAADQTELGDLVKVALGDDVFQVAQLAQRGQQHQHHAKAAEHRADDEVERENRRVPARELRRAKVEADDGTHREHQQRAKAAEHDVGLLVVVPLPRRAGPAHREETENRLADTRRRAVAQHGEIGNHAHEPEQRRHHQIGVHREHVPHER